MVALWWNDAGYECPCGGGGIVVMILWLNGGGMVPVKSETESVCGETESVCGGLGDGGV